MKPIGWGDVRKSRPEGKQGLDGRLSVAKDPRDEVFPNRIACQNHLMLVKNTDP